MPNKNFKHLDETTMEQYGPDQWVPSIPLPFYESGWLFKKTVYVCGCGARFSNEYVYREHYRTEQLIEMNEIFRKTRDMQHGKATFWRRAFVVLRHGTEGEKDNFLREFDNNYWPESVNQKRLDTCNEKLKAYWEPVYLRMMREENISLHEAVETGTLEDETPEEAAKTMNKPFSYTNSRGDTYYLHSKIVHLRAGKPVRIYFFAKEVRPDLAEKRLPIGYGVSENPRNGFLAVVKEGDNSEKHV